MYPDNLIIHSYPNSKTFIRASLSFRQGKKITLQIVMAEVSDVMAYIDSRDYLRDLPYRVITHKI